MNARNISTLIIAAGHGLLLLTMTYLLGSMLHAVESGAASAQQMLNWATGAGIFFAAFYLVVWTCVSLFAGREYMPSSSDIVSATMFGALITGLGFMTPSMTEQLAAPAIGALVLLIAGRAVLLIDRRKNTRLVTAHA